jgi:hypothetical protein
MPMYAKMDVRQLPRETTPPPDLAYLDDYLEGRETPKFIVLKGRDVYYNDFGFEVWKFEVLPLLKELTAS